MQIRVINDAGWSGFEDGCRVRHPVLGLGTFVRVGPDPYTRTRTYVIRWDDAGEKHYVWNATRDAAIIASVVREGV